MPDQREVWENIADEWNKYRKHPVKDSINFLENKKGLVLDLACGSGRNFTKIDGTIIGVDFSQHMLAFARKKVKKEKLDLPLIEGDALDLPFKDNTFDSILFANGFHTIKWNRAKKALSEMLRVSKDGASVFISVWNRDQPRFTHASRESYIPWKFKGRIYKRYYYLYSRDELTSLLGKNGFSSIRVYGGSEMAFKKFPKNIIAIARVAKSGQRRK